jgi:exopolysaccharide production protein ExoQ
VVIATIMFATNVTEIFLTFGSHDDAYPPQVRLTFLLVYGVAGILFLASRHALATLITTSPLLVAVLVVPPLSILWSVDPNESLERSVAVIGTSAFGIYLGWRFTLGRIVFLLAVGMAIAVSLSFLAILALPSVGIDPSGQWAGTWRGIHFHKNGLGGASGLACILIGYAIADSRGYRRAAFCVTFVVAFVLLVGSQSTSSLLAVLAVGMLALWARMLQSRPQEVPVLSLITGFAVVIAGVQLIGPELIESALALVGKRADLSSRVPLWGIVWTFIQDRFWLGYGFQAFWDPETTAVRIIGDQLYFKPFYSHNGVLETWLNGGLVLVLLMVGLLALTITKSAILFARWRGLAVSAFPLLFCAYFIMMNFAESTILARNNMVWTLLVTVVVFTSKWVRLRVL